MAINNSNQPKKVFSIAVKYLEVLDILKQVENQSEFICQAIIEKWNTPNRGMTDKELEQKVKSILAEMMTDDCVIIAHKGDLQRSQITSVPAEPKTMQASKPQEEDMSLIKDIAGKW